MRSVLTSGLCRQISGFHITSFGDREEKSGARIGLGFYPNSATVMLNNFLAAR